METPIVITRKGSKKIIEHFDRSKLHSSILAVCLSCKAPEGQAEIVASQVCNDVIKWLEKHPEVTNFDIRTVAAKSLKKYHTDAAYLYEQRYIII